MDKHQLDLQTSGYKKSSAPPTTEASTDVTDQTLQQNGNVSRVKPKLHSQPNIQNGPGTSNQQASSNSNNANTLNSDAQTTPAVLPTEPPTLNCVPPRRAIYLSGFNPETTIDDIHSYVNYYANAILEINIRKMKFHQQSRSAVFVIYVGTDENNFNLLCNRNFWPQFANCREYDFFRSRRVSQQIMPPSQTD